MNIGEKIQACRRNKNMSQEELGQALLVSRQTISLWETGQTLPTIDNLIRLKEVFGMSLDSILCPEEKESEPNETYTFEGYADFNRTVADTSAKKRLFESANTIIIFAMIAAVSVIFFGANFIVGIVVGLLCSAVFALCKYRVEGFKAIKESDGEAISLEYLVYDDCVLIKTLKNGEVKSSVKADFAEISNIYDVGEHIAVELDGRLYPLVKADVDENSALYKIRRLNASMSPDGFFEKLRKTLLVYLTVLSFASVALALATIVMLSSKSGGVSDYMWVFFAFTPVPLALAVYGTILRIRKQGGTLGIILGVFLVAVLCLYGSFSFIF